MDPTSSLDLISKEKIHHFFLFLPLLTLILLRANLIILVIYTIIWALSEVYVVNLVAFKNQSTKAIVSPPDPHKKLRIRDLFRFLQESLWFIKDVWLFVLLMILVCGTFIVTFILSIVYIEQEYMFFIMLAHLFLGVFMWRLLNIINYISSLTKVKEKFKNEK